MRWAVYDIGSNSIKLLLAEQTPECWRIFYEKSIVTRLGRGVQSSGSLDSEAMRETWDCLRKLASKAAENKATNAVAVATSAVRDSRNRKEFLKEAAAIIGANVRLLSGDEEAQTIFTGAASNSKQPEQQMVVIDIGGGSVEWILGKGKVINKSVSLPLGCVRVGERFISKYPIGPEIAQTMRQTLAGQIKENLDAAFFNPETTLIATGGTASTIFTIVREMRDFSVEEIDGKIIPKNEIETAYKKIIDLDLEKLREMPGLPRARAEVIGPGVALMLANMDVMAKTHLTVSLKGLRCGLLQQISALPVEWLKL